jgi:hypothetical protein
MQTLKLVTIFLLAAVGIAGAQEATQQAPKLELSKRTTLNEKQQLQWENAQLKLQILQMQQGQFNDVLQGIVMEVCKSMGGASDTDCTVVPPNAAEKTVTILLKAKPANGGQPVEEGKAKK